MKAKSNKRIWVEFWERMDQRTRRNFLDGFEYMAELYNEWLQDKGVVAECGFCKKMYVEADSDWYGHCSESCSLDTYLRYGIL